MLLIWIHSFEGAQGVLICSDITFIGTYILLDLDGTRLKLLGLGMDVVFDRHGHGSSQKGSLSLRPPVCHFHKDI